MGEQLGKEKSEKLAKREATFANARKSSKLRVNAEEESRRGKTSDVTSSEETGGKKESRVGGASRHKLTALFHLDVSASLVLHCCTCTAAETVRVRHSAFSATLSQTFKTLPALHTAQAAIHGPFSVSRCRASASLLALTWTSLAIWENCRCHSTPDIDHFSVPPPEWIVITRLLPEHRVTPQSRHGSRPSRQIAAGPTRGSG